MHNHKASLSKINADAQELKELLCSLLPPGNTYFPVVQKEQQLKQLNLLNENISNESFYFVFNLLTGELENVKGVDKWLGYPDKEFTVNRYLNCIHPAQSIQFNMIAHSMYKILCQRVFNLRFSTQRYISLVALKHNNGEYIVFKKTTSVFQYDYDNRLLAQLNQFDKIEAYDGAPLKPRVTEMDGLQKDDFERLVFSMALKNFMDEKYFSEKEFEILQCYATHESMNSRLLAELLHVAALTIDKYNKRILEKARRTFTHPFNNAREVALYLKKEKIIG